jgi:prepilin-type processing-associated H-X9-DG protein
VDQNSDLAALDKLKMRIQALRAKTIDNGCTEDEALSAAAKVAELLDRYDLSLTDIEMREAPCERRVFETHRKKRIPLDDCIGAVANFCDCRVWREKNQAGESRYVFFGLRSDIEVAHYLTELLDGAVRSELGRYKTTSDYRRFRHNERHLANTSFADGRVHRGQADGNEGRSRQGEPQQRPRLRCHQGFGRRCRVRQARLEFADAARRRPYGVADGL